MVYPSAAPSAYTAAYLDDFIVQVRAQILVTRSAPHNMTNAAPGNTSTISAPALPTFRPTNLLRCGFIFGVYNVDTNAVKSVSVTKRDSVTLNTDVTELQRDDQILWMFGPRDTRIAEIYKQIISVYDKKEKFRDRLNVDSQTGSLTIKNIRNEHSGLYKLQIFSQRGTSYKRFNVTVYAHLPIPQITITQNHHHPSNQYCPSSSSSSNQYCSLLCSAVNVSAVTLSWYKGNSLLSSISVSDLSISLSLPLEVEYQEKNTYSCVLNNPIRNQTQLLNITQLCHMCEAPPSDPVQCCGFTEAVIRLVVSAVVGVAAFAVVVYYIRS
ncbi:SLAM family member 5-like [Cyprinus carpio]|uniref:SLAM family member 5-like n=1 Tax=Cyprinus carpio TaxID=7962 RepID=A0A9Q9XP85_CYPCA|nr:SLAM family member 5-like [Cyprinus carpio]